MRCTRFLHDEKQHMPTKGIIVYYKGLGRVVGAGKLLVNIMYIQLLATDTLFVRWLERFPWSI